MFVHDCSHGFCLLENLCKGTNFDIPLTMISKNNTDRLGWPRCRELSSITMPGADGLEQPTACYVTSTEWKGEGERNTLAALNFLPITV